MNNISRARFLIKINSFFSGLRLRRLSRAAGGEQGARLKGNDQVARLSKDVATFFSSPGGSRRRWRTGRWTSRTTTTPTRRTRMDAFPRTWISTHSTVKVSSSFHIPHNNCSDTGVCKWTGCDARCEDMAEFSKHITGEREKSFRI